MVKEKTLPPERITTSYAANHYVTITYNEDGITINFTRDVLEKPAHPKAIIDLTNDVQVRLIQVCIKNNLPQEKYVLLAVVMTLIMRGMYFRSEMSEKHEAVFAVTFTQGFCRFTSYDSNHEECDYKKMVAESGKNNKGGALKETAKFLRKLCDEVVIADTQGLKYSGSFEFVPVAVKN